MTSSHFADHQLAHGCDSSTVLTLNLPDDLFSQLENVAKRECRSIQGQVLFILKRTLLNKGPVLSWGSTTAGVSFPKEENGCLTAVHSVSDDNTAAAVEVVEAVQAVPEQALSDSLPQNENVQEKKEDSKGLRKNNSLLTPREKGTNPRAKCTSPKTKNDPFARKILAPDLVPDDLSHLSELIREFWAVKKGSRTESRWKRLLKKLRSMKPEEQAASLEDACNSGWGDLYPRSANPQAGRFNRPAEPQTAHPASKVFKASDLDWPHSDWPRRTHETLPKIEGTPDIKNILPDF